mgnify:CR=1 FL=1
MPIQSPFDSRRKTEMETTKIIRKTNETDIVAELKLNGEGKSSIQTGIGFFDHMLTLFAFHSGMDLNLCCKGDLEVDMHHSIEDIGITLGQAMNEALKERIGIQRYGNAFLPMDEAMAQVTLDLCRRSYLVYHCELPVERVGGFECEMLEEFLRAFAFNTQMTLHVNLLYGKNAHHMIEAIFKGLGQALKQAIQPTKDQRLMSTKGQL